MKFILIYRVLAVLYLLLVILSFVGHLMFILGDVVVATEISRSMIVFLLVGFGVVFFEHRKYPENFADNPKILGYNIDNPVLKFIESLLSVYAFLMVLIVFYDPDVDFLPKDVIFDYGVSGVMLLFVFSLVPLFEYRRKIAE